MDPEKPRLALFLASLSAGGAQRVAVRLAGGIAARGYSVDMVLASAKGAFLSEVPGTVRVVDLGARRAVTSLPRLVRYLRQDRPAAMLSCMDHVNVVAVGAWRLARVPVRLLVSEHSTLSRRATRTSSLYVKCLPALARRFYPRADGVIAVSRGVADDLVDRVGIPRDRVKVIYNPVVTPELFEKVQEPLNHPWFDAGSPPVVLTVGRLSEEKDISTLIRAFAQVRRDRLAKLLVLGEGEERERLERLAAELEVSGDVEFHGFVQNPYPFMSQAALFVLSSRREGLPGVLIEALACGSRVVSTDCPSGPREILQGGRYGRLVPVGDADGLARAIAASLGETGAVPSSESWRPFAQQTVVDQYLDALLG